MKPITHTFIIHFLNIHLSKNKSAKSPNIINIEKISLNSYLTIQKSLNKQILSFLKSFVSDIKIDLEYDTLPRITFPF